MNSHPTTLAATAVHLWLLFTDKPTDPAQLPAYEALLDADERARYGRLRLARIRRQYLLARALVRTTLSHYTPLDPQDWRFVHNAHGRPEIANPGAVGLRFNLSHADGLMVCAVSRNRDVGVDVESIDRHNRSLEIAERFFSATECRDLRAQPAARQYSRFFDYWTLKEAYIKARGLGLACPLGRFGFRLSADEPIRLWVDADLDERPQRWRCWLWRPTPRHRLALCVEAPVSATLMYRTTPLVETTDYVCPLLLGPDTGD